MKPSPFRIPIVALCIACTGLPAMAATVGVYGTAHVTAPAGSDTWTWPQLMRQPIYNGTITAISSTTFSVNGSPAWGTDTLATGDSLPSYALITTGFMAGHTFEITANGAADVTVDTAGVALDQLSTDDGIAIVPYWTLGTLFPASDSGTSFQASTVSTMNTEIIVPNFSFDGTNPPGAAMYYFLNGAWRKVGQDDTISVDDTVLPANRPFILRNLGNATNLWISGQVNTWTQTSVLGTSTAHRKDNLIAPQRATNVTLDALDLGGTSAFVTTTSPLDLKDVVLAYSNSLAVENKAPSASYFYYNSAWRKVGQDVSIDAGSDVVLGADKFLVVRKAITNDGASSTWIDLF